MSESLPGRIVVCGHLCLDIIPSFPASGGAGDWFRPGRLSLVGAPVISPGGAVSNVGLALRRLGIPVRLAAKIGDDPIGTLILERIEASEAELTAGIARVPGEVSSYTVVLSPPSVDRIFLHCPGANDTFSGDDVSESALGEASVFHFGYPPLMKRIWSDGGAALEKLLSRARAAGALTSLDMSLPDPSSPSGALDWDAYLGRVLAQVDLFVPSVEELVYMMDRDGFARLARGFTFDLLSRLSARAIERGASLVLIKLGDRGAYLRSGPRGLRGRPGWESRELFTPVFAVPHVAGTTGAGDSTIAGLLSAIFKGLAPERALSVAVAVGGCCVEAPDATSGIRSWSGTVARIDAGWKKGPAGVSEPGWMERGDGVWSGPHDAG